MASIALDIAVDPGNKEEWKSEFVDFLDQLDLTHKILEDKGPGGGWPVVDIIGDEENIKKYLIIYCGDDEEQAEEYHEQIEE